ATPATHPGCSPPNPATAAAVSTVWRRTLEPARIRAGSTGVWRTNQPRDVSRQTRFDRPAAVRRGRRPRDAAHVHLRGDENRRISMNEMIFGSGSPMWSAMPSIGLAYQPMSVTNRPIGAPLFSSPAIAGAIGGGLT